MHHSDQTSKCIALLHPSPVLLGITFFQKIVTPLFFAPKSGKVILSCETVKHSNSFLQFLVLPSTKIIVRQGRSRACPIRPLRGLSHQTETTILELGCQQTLRRSNINIINSPNPLCHICTMMIMMAIVMVMMTMMMIMMVIMMVMMTMMMVMVSVHQRYQHPTKSKVFIQTNFNVDFSP